MIDGRTPLRSCAFDFRKTDITLCDGPFVFIRDFRHAVFFQVIQRFFRFFIDPGSFIQVFLFDLCEFPVKGSLSLFEFNVLFIDIFPVTFPLFHPFRGPFRIENPGAVHAHPVPFTCFMINGLRTGRGIGHDDTSRKPETHINLHQIPEVKDDIAVVRHIIGQRRIDGRSHPVIHIFLFPHFEKFTGLDTDHPGIFILVRL